MAAPWRIFWLFVLVFHAVAAVGWLWLAPGGFPLSHPRMLTNLVVPGVVMVLTGAVFHVERRGRADLLLALLAAFPAAWAMGGITARFVFPRTFGLLFLAPLAGGLLMAATLALAFRGRRPHRAIVGSMAAGGLLGGLLTNAIRPPAAETRPRPEAPPAPIAGVAGLDGAIGPRAFVHMGDGSISIKAKPLTLSVQPMLRFLDRSPDGAPTVLVPRRIREVRDLRLVGARAIAGGLDLRYRSSHDAALRVEADEDGAIRIDASASLPATAWSHLNSYCDVDVSGHRRLSLSFSPCPDARIEVRPMDYPFGRPLRFAFLDATGRFRVVEASSGEKGPFRDLAAGSLSRDAPLAITLYDRDHAFARLTLEDWSSQLAAQFSPTAGWGAPVNAIEFCLAGDEPTSAASVYVTLAATSVGRGWDCVGHRAGTYRNRMRVEVFDSP